MHWFIDLSQTTCLYYAYGNQNRSSFCTWRGSSIMVHWSVPAVFQWDLVYFAKVPKQSSCHIQGSVLLYRTIWWHTLVMWDTWKVQDWEQISWMGISRSFFPHFRNPPNAGRSVYGEDHYQQFEHRLSAGPVLWHTQYEGISLNLLQNCYRVGELIHQMVCWKDFCRFSVLESCSQNCCDSGGRWTQEQ